jgi:hypothetical protein
VHCRVAYATFAPPTEKEAEVATTSTRTNHLSDEQLVAMSALIKDCDSVELKLTVPETQHGPTVQALELDPVDAQIRQVFFFDTPDLTLYEHGIVARARRVQGKGDDSVVKLRPVVPSELPAAVRSSPDFGVEVDAMPGGFVCSGSLKGMPKNDVRGTVAGGGRLQSLFSKPQREFYSSYAPDGVAFDDLSVLGPIFVLKLKFSPKELARKMVAEMWLYPDGSRILELSTKCLPNEAFQVAAESRVFLTGRGVDLGGEQETKTRKALEFFSKRLKSTDGS